ncbi:hypothetical protein [Photorhabdus sp. RM71S]
MSLEALKAVELLLPMHDAVLVQVPLDFEDKVIAELLANVMSDHFGQKIVGKASIDTFFED